MLDGLSFVDILSLENKTKVRVMVTAKMSVCDTLSLQTRRENKILVTRTHTSSTYVTILAFNSNNGPNPRSNPHRGHLTQLLFGPLTAFGRGHSQTNYDARAATKLIQMPGLGGMMT